MPLRKRATEDGEILAEHEDKAAVDRARARHHAVAGDVALVHAEVDAIMLDEHVELFERAFVEEDLQPLTGSQTPLGVLGVDALLSAAQAGLGASLVELLEGRGHRSPFLGGGVRAHCTVALRSANVVL